MIKSFIDLGGEAIQLLTTALGRLLLGVYESNPQTRCPGISNRPPVPLSASLELVTGDEVGCLGNRGGYNIWPSSRGHIAAARPTMAVSGWAMTRSQSCTTRGSRPVHRMFCDSQSPWPIHTRPGVEVSRSLTRRAASSTHSGPPTRLRSCPCSSKSGHSPRPGWSHPVHGGEGTRSRTAAGAGAEPIRRARRAAKGAAPASVGRGLPPGTSVSAVTVIP